MDSFEIGAAAASNKMKDGFEIGAATWLAEMENAFTIGAAAPLITMKDGFEISAAALLWKFQDPFIIGAASHLNKIEYSFEIGAAVLPMHLQIFSTHPNIGSQLVINTGLPDSMMGKSQPALHQPNTHSHIYWTGIPLFAVPPVKFIILSRIGCDHIFWNFAGNGSGHNQESKNTPCCMNLLAPFKGGVHSSTSNPHGPHQVVSQHYRAL